MVDALYQSRGNIMAIVLDEPTLFENVLNYALFVGAFFQLVCIFAAVVVPQSSTEKEDELTTKSQSSLTHQPSHNRSHESSSRRGKKEKKKHR
ncbi:protein manbal [Plakobranchus ocellatus]|uniref:Protein manbal n=1 Tax=Plakobranchus ocellatus TaxID=259542 RepID=A0AAV4BRP2_9GAST|nr:protein manbal [Plakobranchus ocellatus]